MDSIELVPSLLPMRPATILPNIEIGRSNLKAAAIYKL